MAKWLEREREREGKGTSVSTASRGYRESRRRGRRENIDEERKSTEKAGGERGESKRVPKRRTGQGDGK